MNNNIENFDPLNPFNYMFGVVNIFFGQFLHLLYPIPIIGPFIHMIVNCFSLKNIVVSLIPLIALFFRHEDGGFMGLITLIVLFYIFSIVGAVVLQLWSCNDSNKEKTLWDKILISVKSTWFIPLMFVIFMIVDFIIKLPFFIEFRWITFLLTFFNASSENIKINIISDKLHVDMDERKSTFTGNVYAHNTNLKVWSDEMVVNLKLKKDEIRDIIASGNVKIVRLVEGGEIYGDQANYSLENEIIIIKGNVIVKENSSQVNGNELIVDLKNSSSIMVGSNSNRVEAIIIDN